MGPQEKFVWQMLALYLSLMVVIAGVLIALSEAS